MYPGYATHFWVFKLILSGFCFKSTWEGTLHQYYAIKYLRNGRNLCSVKDRWFQVKRQRRGGGGSRTEASYTERYHKGELIQVTRVQWWERGKEARSTMLHDCGFQIPKGLKMWRSGVCMEIRTATQRNRSMCARSTMCTRTSWPSPM